ncbi:hypothetical protein D3C85_1310530 [compost metagenome]
MRFEGLTQQRRAVGLSLLGFAQGDSGGAELLLKLRLTLAEFAMLLRVQGNLRRQGCQQRIDLGFTGELVPLRGQLFEAGEPQAFTGQGFPVGLRRLQLFAGGQMFVLQATQVLEPGVLQFKLFELRLLGLVLLLRLVEAPVQFRAGFG